MKKIFSKEFLNEKKKIRKGVVMAGALILVCCMGVVNNRIQNENALGVSAGYGEYEEQEMDAHNGEVLVDSLNLTKYPGSSQEAENTDGSDADAAGQGEEKTTEMVSSDEYTGNENTDAYFREARETITSDRGEMLTMLNDTIDKSGDGSEKSSAQEQKKKMIEYMNMEKSLESLIRNKGFSDAFVLITDQSVNVTVQQDSLSESEAAKILDIVLRETERDVEDVVIQAKAS